MIRTRRSLIPRQANEPRQNSQPLATAAFNEPHEAVRRRAEEIYTRNGKIPGHDLGNWAQAEQEILREIRPAAPRTPLSSESKTRNMLANTVPTADGYRPGEFGPGASVLVTFNGHRMQVLRPTARPSKPPFSDGQPPPSPTQRKPADRRDGYRALRCEMGCPMSRRFWRDLGLHSTPHTSLSSRGSRFSGAARISAEPAQPASPTPPLLKSPGNSKQPHSSVHRSTLIY